jgi:hypothetical protein
MLPGIDALIDTFLCNITIKEFRVVLNSHDESLMFAEFFPNVRKIMFDSVIMRSNVK